MVAISHARGKNDMTQNEKCDNISYGLSFNDIQLSILIMNITIYYQTFDLHFKQISFKE